MSDSAERYLQAARRDSTQWCYAQAIEHFEVEWGGGLPASSENIVRYLAAYGPQLYKCRLHHVIEFLCDPAQRRTNQVYGLCEWHQWGRCFL